MKEIYTAYAAADDLTFIMEMELDENGEYITEECIGWYAGEPSDEHTKTYMNCLTENIEWKKKNGLI